MADVKAAVALADTRIRGREKVAQMIAPITVNWPDDPAAEIANHQVIASGKLGQEVALVAVTGAQGGKFTTVWRYSGK